MKTNTGKNACATASMLLVVGFAFGQNAKKDEGWSQLLPPGDGRQAVLDSCTTCHNLKVVVHARLSQAAWTKDVNDMIQRGAPLFPEEIAPITAYLARVFAPDVPKLVNVNTATREEFEKLGLRAETVGKILEARPFKNSEELRRAVGLEKPEFEKIQYLIKYRD